MAAKVHWKLGLKPNICAQSKPRTRFLKCFVLITLHCKTKHLKSLVRGMSRNNGLDVLGLV